jgi:hypothetical protein
MKHSNAVTILKKEIAILTSIATNSLILADDSEHEFIIELNKNIESLSGSVDLLLSETLSEPKVELVAVDVIDPDAQGVNHSLQNCIQCFYKDKPECNLDAMCGDTSVLPKGKTYIYKEVK